MDTNKNPIEILYEALRKEREDLRTRRLKLKNSIGKIEQLIRDLVEIGCEISFPNTIDVSVTGDKHKFLLLLRTLNRHGLRTPKIEKGATGFSEFFYPEGSEVTLWVRFSSTVCRRVKVGTKMVEQDIYDTVCDEIYPHGEAVVAAPDYEDSIPF